MIDRHTISNTFKIRLSQRSNPHKKRCEKIQLSFSYFCLCVSESFTSHYFCRFERFYQDGANATESSEKRDRSQAHITNTE